MRVQSVSIKCKCSALASKKVGGGGGQKLFKSIVNELIQENDQLKGQCHEIFFLLSFFCPRGRFPSLPRDFYSIRSDSACPQSFSL